MSTVRVGTRPRVDRNHSLYLWQKQSSPSEYSACNVWHVTQCHVTFWHVTHALPGAPDGRRRQTCVVGRAEMSRISTRTLPFPFHSQIVCSRVRLACWLPITVYHQIHSFPFCPLSFSLRHHSFGSILAAEIGGSSNGTAVVDLFMFLLTLYLFMSQEHKTIKYKHSHRQLNRLYK